MQHLRKRKRSLQKDKEEMRKGGGISEEGEITEATRREHFNKEGASNYVERVRKFEVKRTLWI